ncbi:MAG: oligosaccharide flippase family protein [Bradymonadaceae bacterium]|nr:oligosaccharide flippase family protein [Lujinxingiaceae bacterium]
MAEAVEAPSKDTAALDHEAIKKTGRGFLVITAAKVWFLVTSAVIQLGLPIIFGSAEQFGVFKIVTETIGLINMVMIIGSLQAVSKLVSEQPERASQVVRLAVRLQLMLGVPVALLYALGSPYIAASFNDPSLTGLFRLSSLIILFYAFYAIFVGYLNGLKEFVKQASLDMTFATMKMVGILGLVLLGFGVIGAVAGFVIAAGLICVISGAWTLRLMRRRAAIAAEASGPPDAQTRAEASASLKRLLSYLVLVMLYTFALNGIMRSDLFILKAVAADMPAQFAGMENIFALISNKFAGFYGAVLNIARIPYQGVIAVTFVIFPLISQSTFSDDTEKTRGYVRETFRYCLLLIGGVAMLLAFNSDSIIAALYSADYGRAAVALSILSVSIIFFALFYVATTMIIGSGHPLAAVVIMGASMVVSAVLNYVFISRVHQSTMEMLATHHSAPGELALADSPMAAVHQAIELASNRADFAAPYLLEGTLYMQQAAIATTIAMVFGFVVSLCWLYYKFRAVLPVATIARLLLAAVALFGIDQLWPMDPALVAIQGKMFYLLMIVAKMAVMGIAMLGVLAVAREFTAKDFNRFKAVIGRS